MITLAVLTGISAEQWSKEGERAIATGLEVLEQLRGRRSGGEDEETEASEADDDRPRYSG